MALRNLLLKCEACGFTRWPPLRKILLPTRQPNGTCVFITLLKGGEGCCRLCSDIHVHVGGPKAHGLCAGPEPQSRGNVTARVCFTAPLGAEPKQFKLPHLRKTHVLGARQPFRQAVARARAYLRAAEAEPRRPPVLHSLGKQVSGFLWFLNQLKLCLFF